MSTATYDAAIAHLPHGPRARWIRHVISADDDSIIGEGGPPPGCKLVRDGRLAVVTTLELCAQAAALLEIASAAEHAGGEPTVAAQGYVVRARRVQLHHASVRADAPLRATVRRAGAAPPLYTYSVEVRDGERLLLTGSIATFVPARLA